MTTWSEAEGSPQPPGAICFEKEKSYNFSLYSRHATGVTLLLYTARDLVNPALRVPLNHLIHKSGKIWHCRLTADKVANACYYACSVEGPNNPSGDRNFFRSRQGSAGSALQVDLLSAQLPTQRFRRAWIKCRKGTYRRASIQYIAF